ncbi:hypothetical protein N0V86_000643 [Didymella sp. IMI 355093]|nr:hypothetical protein N0V86_000643 [Didymella sp. IMI 355093]
MQQVHYNTDTTFGASTRELAGAALAYLTPPADISSSQALSSKHTFTPAASGLPDETALASTVAYEYVGPIGVNEPRIKVEIETPPASLPSLLQYVDHVLMRDKDKHDHPPDPTQKCTSCSIQWDKVSIPSTFLPLSPCGHWIHYRCFIELATRGGDSHEGTCYICNIPLYEWDGINTLTLASRTNVSMKNDRTTASSPHIYALVTSDRDDYEHECNFIEKMVDGYFFKQLAKPSGFTDHSPDLVQCFNGVLNDLRLMGRPTSKWLTWSTTTGSLLFGMLVAIKMQRYLTENHGRIKQTEAWAAWEEGCQVLQARISDDVHQD